MVDVHHAGHLHSSGNDSLWFYLTIFVGALLAGASYLQYREAELQRRYQRQKSEARQRLLQKKNENQKVALEKAKRALDTEDTSSDDDTCSLPSSASSSGRVGGAKEELAKAEGVMRSNSSYVELSQPLTKRMRDDTLDHSRVLSESKHPITRICLTGGPCAGKTTALATLSTVL